MSTLLEAELLWTGAGFLRNGRLRFGDDGRIEAMGADLPGEPERRLDGRALLPGFVNAHSHAFQRGLRGHGERFPAGSGSFWTWREAMYGLVESLDPDRMHALTLAAYREMLAAGITAVGEFHYLHHDASGAGWALDEAVQAAAEEAGIRQVLLMTYYRTGGIDTPLSPAQERFRSRGVDDYWGAFDRAAERAARCQRLGLGAVAHSVRALGLEDLRALHAESVRRSLPFHMHVEEQRQEIEDCRAAYGRTPMALLLDELAVDERFVAVHCTHTTPEDMNRYRKAGGGVCLCPTTEANLGDGIPELGALRVGVGSLSLGTDSNARISMLEEMRWLEYAQRLRTESRGVLRNAEGDVARPLFEIATRGGARALGLEAGVLEPGAWADLLTIDLARPALAGWSEDTLLAAWILGDQEVAEVMVGGRWIAG